MTAAKQLVEHDPIPLENTMEAFAASPLICVV